MCNFNPPNGKFDNRFNVQIDDMKFSENSEDHIKPANEQDFYRRHEYVVLFCKCQTKEPCSDLTKCKNCTSYNALIEKLAGTCVILIVIIYYYHFDSFLSKSRKIFIGAVGLFLCYKDFFSHIRYLLIEFLPLGNLEIVSLLVCSCLQVFQPAEFEFLDPNSKVVKFEDLTILRQENDHVPSNLTISECLNLKI